MHERTVSNSQIHYFPIATQFLKTQEKMASKVRQNYHEESEASINKQINIELNAHYQYMALVICQNCSFCVLHFHSTIYYSRRPITIVMT